MTERMTIPTPPRHLILTGADGYIGSRLAEMALARGCEVTALNRRETSPVRGVRTFAWRLGAPLPAAALADHPAEAQALVHLAHDWTQATPGPDEGALNIEGTRLLLQGARAHAMRFVFVSSQSARADAANVYGRVKWRIEQLLTGDREIAARVGLVYGGPRQGQYGTLSRLSALSPVLPMIDAWRPVQPIRLDEVCEGLLRLAEADPGVGGWFGLAGPEGVPFGDVLREFARELHGKRLRILPVPLRLALLACDVLARSRVGPKPNRERILGLAGTRPMPCAVHLAAIGLAVRPLSQGLSEEPVARRALLAEGRALLGYVLRDRPGPALLRRYVRALPAIGETGALALDPFAQASPTLLRLCEALAGPQLRKRLALALTLVEASPEGERALARVGRASRLAGVASGLVVDSMLLPLRLLR
jgi:nucleoside-diphosphate-sugar epimerase